MENIEKLLQQEAAKFGVELSAEQTAQFQTYMEELLDWNTKINLTAITEPREFVEKHFVDCLRPLEWMNLAGTNCIDVGTGAGFPGIPLKLAVPQMHLTLLDSLQKRLKVLDTVCSDLHLEAKIVHARAEEGGRNPELREKYDYVFARAVAPLSVLCEYCLPYVRQGGYFCAWKGPAGEKERQEAQRAMQILGGKISQEENYLLPDESHRTFLKICHVHSSPAKYPRTGVKIRKFPL